MKRIIILGAAALGLLGVSAFGANPVKADEGCTVAVHAHLNLNGTEQGQDLCLPEGLVLPTP
jgi:hypothetical protein